MKHVAMALCGLAVLLCGCSVDYQAHVESNTEWTGYFNGEKYDGKGNAVIDLGDGRCCTISMLEDGRRAFVRIRVEANGGGVFNPGDTAWIEAHSRYTTLNVCGNDTVFDHHCDPDHDCCSCDCDCDHGC